MSRSNALALLALAVSCALLSLMGCASPPEPPPPCEPPDVVLQLLNDDGTHLVPDHIALLGYGFDRACLSAR